MKDTFKKRTKLVNIVYWISTVWLSLGMTSTAIVQLFKNKTETKFILDMGYPNYILPLLGFWKILGVIAVMVPRFTLLKEWAYAGFFFAMTGAAYSHLALDHPLSEVFPSLLLLALTVLSYFTRPENRKVQPIEKLHESSLPNDTQS